MGKLKGCPLTSEAYVTMNKNTCHGGWRVVDVVTRALSFRRAVDRIPKIGVCTLCMQTTRKLKSGKMVVINPLPFVLHFLMLLLYAQYKPKVIK